MRTVRVIAVFLCIFASGTVRAVQPLVAIHDSELTRTLETVPASAATPHAAGTTGFEWWPAEWHYFVMPESVKEALRSDGVPFVVVSDTNIANGALLDSNGAPNYPIVISLASEAISDSEIQPLLDYVSAGGTLFVGSSAFTRKPDGTTRGDFAIAAQMGIHMADAKLLNWITTFTFSKQIDHRLVAHIPVGVLTWRLPRAADEISWGISPTHDNSAPHLAWKVVAGGAQVLANDDVGPYLLVKNYGKGRFIYHAAMQPLIAHGAWAPGMYAYVIFREAVRWAFESQSLPLPRLSPWPYPYDAAFNMRHDFENDQTSINGIEASAQAEYAVGAKGDYYFSTGALRVDMGNSAATIASLRRAVTNYNAAIGAHNGGLPNPNNPALTNADFDYWHWGPDEGLDVTPNGYASGKDYALSSITNSYLDVENWLAGLNNANGSRIWVSPFFNSTREDSYDLLQQIGVITAGEQKLTPFPHWTLSTRTSGKKYPFLSLPVSDWFLGKPIAQSMEYHTSASMHAAVDYYYSLGALINIYSHSVSSSGLTKDYINYCTSKPRLWAANAIDVHDWWGRRTAVQVTPTVATSGSQTVVTLAVAGAIDPQTAVDVWIPQSVFSGLEVKCNGTSAASDQFRTNGQLVRIWVGTTVTNVEIRYTIQTTALNDAYTAVSGQVLTVSSPGVLANDAPGVPGNILTAALVTAPTSGTLALNADGGFIYTATTAFTGTDTFTYSASDGQTNSAVAAVSITVLPPPPVITSGTSATATQGQPFSYQILATNNPTSYNAMGLPAGLGVNTATGLISGTPTTTGTSNVTISAINAGGTGSAIRTIMVQSPYAAWQNLWFTAADLADPSIGRDLATPAGDGIPNLVKYALNLNPKFSGASGLPRASIATSGSDHYLTLTYTRVISATDISYIPEVSGDLRQWYSVSPVSVTNNPDGVTQTVVAQDMVPVNSTGSRFIRLKVTKP